MQQEETLIRIEQVTKIYQKRFRKPRRAAVNDLSLSILRGEIFGFLGPNGAGKTTTIKLMLGFIFPNRGQILLFNQPPGSPAAKKRLGFLPELAYYYRYLKARELLAAYAELFGLSKQERTRRIESLLALVGLTEFAETELREFSKGMLQRFGLAQALINDPELLILDEPTSGLDPIGRKEIRDIILQLHRQGKTIFFSSHELSQVELICTRVGILNQGKLVREGKLADLLSSAGKLRIEIARVNPELQRKLEQNQQQLGIIPKTLGTTTELILSDKSQLYPLLHLLESESAELVSVNPERETLEDLFVKTVKPQ
ncbi:MAG: ABC transporter ATP-binding protein [bacterium]|nr:ABC transporter ATP-binding protein [bacterium]